MKRENRYWNAKTPYSVLLAALVSAALGIMTFLPALQNEFVYDDLPIIVQNPTVTQSGPWYRFWREPWWPRGTSNDRLYRPLTLWSYRANVVLAPGAAPDPFWFHIVNVGLHAMASAGVALLAHRVTGRKAAAWIAGLLFASHPVHAESVVTGYGRAEVLAGLFAVWLLVRYCGIRSCGPGPAPSAASVTHASSEDPSPTRSGRTPPESAQPRAATFHLINGLLLFAALMSKEHAIFVWPVLMLVDLYHRRAQPSPPQWRAWLNRTVGPPHAFFALATTGFLLLRFGVFGWKGRIPGADLPYYQAPLGHASLVEHLLTPFRLIWLSLELLVWPPRLCPIWSVPALSLADRMSADVLGGLLIVVAILAAGGYLWWRRSPLGAIVLGVPVLLALPVQAVPLANWLFAERWLYLPTVLIAVLVGAALTRLTITGVLFSAALSLVLLPATWSYTGAYRDNLTLLREVVRRQPDNLQAQKNLTGAMLILGEPAAAIQIGREAIARFGDIPEVYLYLTRAYLKLGDGHAALAALDDYMRATADKPGLAYTELRREAEVLIQQKHARDSAPADAAPLKPPPCDAASTTTSFGL